MKVIAHTTDDVFSELKAEWNPLLLQSTTNTIFNTWQWHRNWWQAYHPGELWLLTVRQDDALVGIASFFISTEDDKRVLRFVGCEDVTDYLDVIAHADHTTQVYEALAQFLSQNRHCFDRMSLCNIPEASPTRQAFATALQTQGFQVEDTQMEVCPVLNLDGGWEAYLQRLDKKQRHEIRRKLRRVEPLLQDGSLKWYIVDESHNLQDEMQNFLTLMAQSQQAKARFLQEESHVNFFNNVVPSLFEAGWVQMSFLTINDKPVATYLNFDYNNRILVYNSGLDVSEYGHLSLGIVLLSYNIQHAIDQQRAVFDFLRGDETYKYRMGAQDTPIFNLQAY